MIKSLVVYASKYGSTYEVAQAVADGLGADLAAVEVEPDLSGYEVVVIGSPIYAGDYLAPIVDFVRANASALQTRRIAAFITAAADMVRAPGLTGEDDELLFTQAEYAAGLARLAGGEVLASRGFGGRLVPEQLDESDRKTLNWFYRFLMRDALQGFDLLDLRSAHQWGEELRQLAETP